MASVGALIGYGAAHEQVLRYFTRAYLVRASHLLILAFFIVGGGDPGFSVVLSVISLVASVVFAGTVYWFVYNEILPETLPRDLRRTLRRWPGKAVKAMKAKKPAKGT
jgi:hypothetical protein